MLLQFWQRGSRQAPSATSNEHPASTAQAGVITVRSDRRRETAFVAIPSAKQPQSTQAMTPSAERKSTRLKSSYVRTYRMPASS